MFQPRVALPRRLHKVEEGETLAAIARSFNASTAQIATANKLEAGSELSAGDRLLIPAAFHEPVPAAKAKAKTTPTTAARKAPAPHTTVAAKTTPAKAPVHRPATTTVAQLKDANSTLNR